MADLFGSELEVSRPSVCLQLSVKQQKKEIICFFLEKIFQQRLLFFTTFRAVLNNQYLLSRSNIFRFRNEFQFLFVLSHLWNIFHAFLEKILGCAENSSARVNANPNKTAISIFELCSRPLTFDYVIHL